MLFDIKSMCFWHFGWFKPSFHLIPNLWLPSGPSHILLSSSFCSSIILPLPLILPHSFLWKMRHSPTYEQIRPCVFMYSSSCECLQTLSYKLPVELVRVSLLMDRSASTKEDFWQCKCHIHSFGFRKSNHISAIFLGKKSLRPTGVFQYLALWYYG